MGPGLLPAPRAPRAGRALKPSPSRLPLVAALLALATSLPALPHPFLHDDPLAIAGHPFVVGPRTLDALLRHDLWGHPASASIGSWRPLTTALFALAYALSHGHPYALHALPILFHVVASALFARLLAARLPSARAALFASALFAVHPLHTDAVASCVGLAEPLALSLSLLVLRLHRSRRPLALSPIAFALALLAKESSALLPALLLAHDLSSRDRPLRDRLTRHALLALTLALSLAARAWALGDAARFVTDPVANPLATAPLLTRLAHAPALFARGLLQLALPATLLPDYSATTIPLSISPLTLVGVASLVALLALAYRHRRDPLTVTAVAWLTLPGWAAANGLLRLPVLYAERLWYTPSVGFCLLAGIAFARLEARAPPRALTLTAAALITLFAVRTIVRDRDWRSEEALYAAAVRDAPDNARMRVDLAAVRFDQRRYAESIALCERAAEITPRWGVPHGCVAIAQDRLGHEREAARAFGRMLRSDGVERRWWVEAARFCARTGRVNTARAILDRLREQNAWGPDLDAVSRSLATEPRRP